MPSEIHRGVFLVSKLSGYLMACLRELKKQTGCELMACHWPVASEAPFDETLFAPIDQRLQKDQLSRAELQDAVITYKPDFIFISGWMDKDYLRIARAARKRGIPVIAGCDTQWKGGLRQHAACLVSKYYLHRSIDALWVSGERQREFARRLGYAGRNCLEGYYACDWEAMALKDTATAPPRERAFLYVGRLMERKGTDVLLAAYEQYRAEVAEPWALRIVGTGPMKEKCQGVEGVEDLGFIQPDQLPEVYRKASCFVMPSRYEPWCVSIQEAAANRLPLICTTACGAAVHLLRDGFNGYKVASGDVIDLCDAMRMISGLKDSERTEFSKRSFQLSQQFTPSLWVECLNDWLEGKNVTQGGSEPDFNK